MAVLIGVVVISESFEDSNALTSSHYPQYKRLLKIMRYTGLSDSVHSLMSHHSDDMRSSQSEPSVHKCHATIINYASTQ